MTRKKEKNLRRTELQRSSSEVFYGQPRRPGTKQQTHFVGVIGKVIQNTSLLLLGHVGSGNSP